MQSKAILNICDAQRPKTMIQLTKFLSFYVNCPFLKNSVGCNKSKSRKVKFSLEYLLSKSVFLWFYTSLALVTIYHRYKAIVAHNNTTDITSYYIFPIHCYRQTTLKMFQIKSIVPSVIYIICYVPIFHTNSHFWDKMIMFNFSFM